MPRLYMPKTGRKNVKTKAQAVKTKAQAVPPKFKAGFLAAMDGRTDLAKALRANYDAIVADVGGTTDVGHVKAALVERFCWLEAILQTLEHEMAQGQIDKSEALGKWIQAVNSLSGLAKVLGVERKARSMPWLALPAGPDGSGDERRASPYPCPRNRGTTIR